MQRVFTVLVLLVPMVAFGAWDNVDVGSPTGPDVGSATQSPPGTWTVQGGGEDIWGTSDQFHYLYDTTPVGDFAVDCHVVSLSGSPSTWAKAGIMARSANTTQPPLFQGPEPYVFGCTTSGHGTMIQERTTEGASATYTATIISDGPDDMYLKFVRSGDTFTLYAGRHPYILHQVNSMTYAEFVGVNMYVGLALTAHNSDVDPDVLATAVFDGIDLTAPGISPNAPLNFTSQVNGTNVNLSWTNAAVYSGLFLVRQDAFGNTTELTVSASATSYTDAPGDGAWTYFLGAAEGGAPTIAESCTAVVAAMGVGYIDASGFFQSWLLGGPIADIHPCNTPLLGMTADYLVGIENVGTAQDRVVSEVDIIPSMGDTLEVDFLSVIDGTAVLGPYANSVLGPDVNPLALNDQLVWYAWHDADNGIDQNAIYGDDPNYCVGYAVTYLENTTGSTKFILGGAASDDSIAVLLDNSYVWTNGACRGWGAGVQDVFPILLSPGEHRLITKTFEEAGGFGFRFRLQDFDGTPLTEADGIRIKLSPTMASVPAPVDPITNLTVTDVDLNITLNWTNGQVYDTIHIARVDVYGGFVTMTRSGTATSYTDTIPSYGIYTYHVAGISGGRSAGGASATINAGNVAVINIDGYIQSWLLLGPINRTGGANPGNRIYEDYLSGTDADSGLPVTEANALPEDGQRIEITAPSVGTSGVYGPTTNGQNPEAPDIAQWILWQDSDYRINHNDVYGEDYNDFVVYHVCYLENMTPNLLFLEALAASDDTCLHLLDNSVYSVTYWNSWAETATGSPYAFMLPPGEHRFLMKDFEGSGGNGVQFRLRDPDTGQFILSGDPRVTVRILPDSMTSVPPAPTAVVTRFLSAFSIGSNGTVRLAVTDGPVTIIETVPDNFTIVNTGGGTQNGQQISWTDVAASVTYTAQPTAEGGQFFGFAEETATGVWLTVGGLDQATFPEQIGDWYHVDIKDPGHTTPGPSTVAVVDDAMTISTYLGRDIWGTADELHYVWQEFPAVGGFAIQARVDAFDPLMFPEQAWSKVGIMARTFTSQGSPYVYSMIRSDIPTGIPDRAWQWRDESDINAAHDTGIYSDTDDILLPHWIRLVYNNGLCTGYFADDDGTGVPLEPWWQMTPHVLNTEGADTITAGFAVTTHEAAAAVSITAEISDITITDLCPPCFVTRSYEIPAMSTVDYEGTQTPVYNAGDTANVTLTITGVREPGGGCPALGTTTITEQLPAGWTATGISNGGSFNAGTETVTWQLNAAQLGAAGALTYDASGPAFAPSLPLGGTIEEVGGPEVFEIFGQDSIVTANGLQDDGVIVSWLLLGPLGHNSPAGAHDAAIMAMDHLTDGGIVETNYQPKAGDEITPDYNGAAASTGLNVAMNPNVNPNAPAAQWYAWRDADGSPVDVVNNLLYGTNDQSMVYGVCYLDVSAAVNVYFQAGSDDAIQILLDGLEILNNPADRAWPGFLDSTLVQTLNPGVHTLMVKTFNGTGGWSFGVQMLEELAGPLQGIVCVSLDPAGCGGGGGEPIFKRGDANKDGGMNIADAVYILQNLFAQGPAIACRDAADANDDESVNIADAVYILQNLFAQGPAIPPPGPDVCGPDPVGTELGCETYDVCNL